MATAFKIERDVPAPTHFGPGPPEKYPFSQMQVGDSFVAGAYSTKLANSLTSLACYQRRRHNRHYVVRKHGDVVRVWRIA